MNTQRAPRVRIGLLAAGVVAAGSSLFVIGPARAELQAANKIVLPHQGPGVGSTKTPPFRDVAYDDYLAQQTQAKGDMYFHSTSGQPVVWAYTMVGPGPWSSKAPGEH